MIFQNIDGSISEEIVGIEQDIDWHHPLILSTQKPPTLQETTLTPSVPTTPPNKLAPQATKKAEIKKEEIQADVAVKSFSRVVLSEGIELEIEHNSITIYTKDKKVRDFIVSNPYKIVVDFSKEKSAFVTKLAEFSKAPFVSAALGNHAPAAARLSRPEPYAIATCRRPPAWADTRGFTDPRRQP